MKNKLNVFSVLTIRKKFNLLLVTMAVVYVISAVTTYKTVTPTYSIIALVVSFLFIWVPMYFISRGIVTSLDKLRNTIVQDLDV